MFFTVKINKCGLLFCFLVFVVCAFRDEEEKAAVVDRLARLDGYCP
jgi:hypothetical protein